MDSAKTILTSLGTKADKAELAKRQIEQLRTLAAKCTPSLHLAPGGGGGEKRTLEDNVIRIAEAEKELQQIIDDYTATYLQVQQLIRSLNDPYQQDVLQLFYVDRLKWPQISKKMSFSKSYLRKLRDKAIEVLDSNKLEHE